MFADLSFNPDVLLAIAAIITAIGGVAATLASIRVKRLEQKQKDEDECFSKLQAARKEAEEAAAALHEIRMREAK